MQSNPSKDSEITTEISINLKIHFTNMPVHFKSVCNCLLWVIKGLGTGRKLRFPRSSRQGLIWKVLSQFFSKPTRTESDLVHLLTSSNRMNLKYQMMTQKTSLFTIRYTVEVKVIDNAYIFKSSSY